MKIRPSDLWDPAGSVDRGTYALVGVVGFALKHNLDRGIATLVFHRPWGLFNYFVPIRDMPRIMALHSPDAWFLGTMVAVSLPFIWIGLTMTMKRLRSARLPLPLVILFFVPFLNLLFLVWLCFFPERDRYGRHSRPGEPSLLSRLIPTSTLGSAAVAVLLTVLIGAGLAVLGANFLANYGWGLFVALPFTMGFAAVLLTSFRKPLSLSSSIGVACLSVGLLGVALLALAVEGVFCLIMAAPLAIMLATIGAICAYFAQRQRWCRDGTPAVLAVFLVLVPGLQWLEHTVKQPAPTFVVRSSVDIQAPPEKVWQQVIAFTQIPPPTEWIFRGGIAYPIRAEMIGSGPGAERHCVFSTGAFVEPIEVWDAPRRLKFSVTSNPAPMEEWTPYSHIEPPHLHGFLESNGGQFLLTPLPNGATHLEGTTWYHHRLWPATYWQFWSDAIIHRIHMRVLRHIQFEAQHS